MGPLQLVVSGVITLMVYSVMLFGVYKIFQLATEVAEIKDMLREIRRNTMAIPPVTQGSGPESAEALVRAVHASYENLDEKP